MNLTPKKKEASSMFFRLKIKLEGIDNQEGGILSIPIFSVSQTILERFSHVCRDKKKSNQLGVDLKNHDVDAS